MKYIIYHSADFDGYISGKIIHNWLIEGGTSDEEIYGVPYNYKDEIYIRVDGKKVLLRDVLESKDEVFFVDCLNTKDMEFFRICNRLSINVVVIDHHETAIKFLDTVSDIFGADQNTISKYCKSSSDPKLWENKHPGSAVFLAWKFCYKDKEMPNFFKAISDYDVWYHESDEAWEEVISIQYFLRSFIIDMYDLKKKAGQLFYDMLFDDIFYRHACEAGHSIVEYCKSRNKTLIKTTGKRYFLRIGNTIFRVLVGCDYQNSSALFEWGLGKDSDEYKWPNLFILARPIFGSTVTPISIISNSDYIDAAYICEKFGGGGHHVIGGCVVKVKVLEETMVDEETKDELHFIELTQADLNN